MSEPTGARHLLQPATIRERTGDVFSAGLEGTLEHFAVDLDALDDVADRVTATTKKRYPDLQIPYHSRWGHFRVGGVDRVADFEGRIAGADAREQGRKRVALAVTSVLLDAGAGPAWSYREGRESYARSEGLAVASYHMFVDGSFSAMRDDPLRADADELVDLERGLAEGFQVRDDNPLVGLEGREALLRKLGEAIVAAPEIFGDEGRLGGLFDHLYDAADDGKLPAARILQAVLQGLGPIWPGRLEMDGIPLGDVWPHPAAGGEGDTKGLVPLHKLSQWTTYSLLEPMEAAGLTVTGLDELTGLAEYRNGGLFVDGGVLVPKHEAVVTEAHAPGSAVIVEWRALTVALLDLVAVKVRERLGLDAERFPLAKVLEGGTWHAGREIAREKRDDGTPPIRIESDGTVF
ncbi:MAG: uracil phosphoribosyltransferase [Sandaracinus sp.]|nr:uracil phosphoribosyltransferase [Sandaracinus sp.]|tara:strand:- start:1402 stop:2619 length:1218 start_codon:yes stop_codon:yes gene_type:complete